MISSRILVVDDEPQLRSVLRSTLSALGFVVADAETGEAALVRIREEKFDLILLDINMPGLSGLETCRAIRARSDVGILMLTVRDAIPSPQPLATAEFTTLRMRLIKIAARITETATRVRIAFAAACPEAVLFRGIALSLQPAGP